MPKIDISISKKIFNDVYLPYLENNERYNIFIGGAGSGKSVFVSQKYIYKLLKYPKRKLLVVRKIQRHIRDSVWAEFMNTFSEWKIGDLIKCNISTSSMLFPNGSQIIFKGLDDPEKIKSIQGITDIFIEEGAY